MGRPTFSVPNKKQAVKAMLCHNIITWGTYDLIPLDYYLSLTDCHCFLLGRQDLYNNVCAKVVNADGAWIRN